MLATINGQSFITFALFDKIKAILGSTSLFLVRQTFGFRYAVLHFVKSASAN